MLWPVAAGVALLCLTGESRPQPPAPVVKAEVDKLGDPIPTGAVFRIGTTRFRHGGAIQCLAYTADGKTLAAGGGNDVVRLWDADGKLVRTFPLSWAKTLALSKDGKYLAAAGSGWRLRTTRQWIPGRDPGDGFFAAVIESERP